jgi:hypothetical protein
MEETFERLKFILPAFTRICWASDRAQEVWGPRLSRIVSVWPAVECASVVFCVRKCAVVRIPLNMYTIAAATWASHGFSSLPVVQEFSNDSADEALRPPARNGASNPLQVVVGKLVDIVRFRECWTSGNVEQIGKLLGYPDCCCREYRSHCVEGGLIDTTWPASLDSVTSIDRVAQIPVLASSLTNMLWRWLGIRAIPHLPCTFECKASSLLAEQMLTTGTNLGHQVEMDWIRQILSWPVEWSILHGIAEVKTPVLKFSTRSDSTAHKYVVRWTGSTYPEEGSRGTMFPYRSPSRALISESPGFRRDRENLIKIEH